MVQCIYEGDKMKKKLFMVLVISCIMFVPVIVNAEEVISCGANTLDIPVSTAKIMRNGYNLLRGLVPVILIVMGVFDFARAIIGSNEDEIKKKQNKFIKRLIAAVIVFLLMSAVQWIFAILADIGFVDARGCINAILNGKF